MLYAIFALLSWSLLAGALPTEDTRQLGKAYFANDGRVLADSEVFPYAYTLNSSAPFLSTHDELLAQADVHNKKVRIERLNGTLMLLSSSLQQVGTLSGELESDIEAVYPDQATIAKARISVHEQLAAKNSTVAPVSERDLSSGILEKLAIVSRQEDMVKTPNGVLPERSTFCGGCVLFWNCWYGRWKEEGCDTERHICVVFICVGL